VILDLLDIQVTKMTVWSLGWFWKMDSKPVKMLDENGSCFWPVGEHPLTIKMCIQVWYLSSGLREDLHS